jgi:hypothetical protein
MGGFIEKCKKLVIWIGDIIYRVVKWFEGLIRIMIEEIVNAFLIKNKKKILQAQNKELTAKVAAQMKTIQELTKVAEKEKKKLSSHDQDIIQGLFNTEDLSIK